MPLPAHLRTGRAEGFIPGELIAQYEWGPLRNLTYLILDRATKSALVVDPQKDLKPVDDLLANGFTLAGVLLTHTHHDHIAGLPGLLSRFPDLPVYLHADDVHRLSHLKYGTNGTDGNRRILSDGATFRIGEIELIALHSPGHSAGGLCYRVRAVGKKPEYLLTGDTLFIRDCGRTDLATGDDAEMFATLQKIKALPDDLILLPGHHYALETSSLLGVEKKASLPLLCASVEELRALP